MKILILSRTERYYATHRLVKEARKLKHSIRVIDPLKYIIEGAKVSYKPDVIIPRIGNIAIEYSLAMVKQFELAGVKSINTSDAIYLAKDKFVSLMALQSKGLPVPETYMARNKTNLVKAGKKMGG